MSLRTVLVGAVTGAPAPISAVGTAGAARGRLSPIPQPAPRPPAPQPQLPRAQRALQPPLPEFHLHLGCAGSYHQYRRAALTDVVRRPLPRAPVSSQSVGEGSPFIPASRMPSSLPPGQPAPPLPSARPAGVVHLPQVVQPSPALASSNYCYQEIAPPTSTPCSAWMVLLLSYVFIQSGPPQLVERNHREYRSVRPSDSDEWDRPRCLGLISVVAPVVGLVHELPKPWIFGIRGIDDEGGA